MPAISVIIPVYNVEKYLPRCLDSVLGQTFKDFELICVNDGSPDNCDKILADFSKRDSRLKIVSQKNQGLSMARNNGLKVATGSYIYFLDSDDAIHPQTLEICYNFAQKYKADMVSFGYGKSDGVKYEPQAIKPEKIKHKVSNDPLFLGCKKSRYRVPLNVWTKLYKKDLIDGIEFIPNIHFEDYPHTYAVLARKPKTVMLLQDLYFYTINYESITNQKAKPKQIADYHVGMNFVYEIYKSPKLKKEFKFLLKDFVPDILKQQLGRCKRSNIDVRQQMFQRFAEELADLDRKGMIKWRGHKLSRYFTYKKLIKEYNQ